MENNLTPQTHLFAVQSGKALVAATRADPKCCKCFGMAAAATKCGEH